MWLAMVNGWDNVMTPRANWDPSYLYGMKFFCGNDNWGAMNWRKRAEVIKDGSGNVTGFRVDGYYMTPDIAPQFWNGGMMDWYGNSKDCLIHVFPGNGLVFMNPGFEIKSSPPNSNLPHFWTPFSSSAPSERYDVDDTVFHGGGRSLKLARTTAGLDGVFQLSAKRSALPGVSYRASAWCKTVGVSGEGARLYIKFVNLDGSQKSGAFYASSLTGDGDWRRMEVVASGPAYTSRIEVGCCLEDTGVAYFDDVVISMECQQELGAVCGYTLDESQTPVPFSIVRTTTGTYQVVSDANGYFEMTGIPAGTYDFVCRKEGYVPHRVKNQTVAPGKLTFVSFNMGVPKPGLTVSNVTSNRAAIAPGGAANVTVSVSNSKPYPVVISDVGVFVEEDGKDVTGKFEILAASDNPKLIPASASAQFAFSVTSRSAAPGQTFSINAYAFGQEDRPNMLVNGNFDLDNKFMHWGFYSSTSVCQWFMESSDVFSPPYALKHVASDPGTGKFNWAGNYSAWGASAVSAYPNRNYVVGASHKDVTTCLFDLLLYIEEYYYDGSRWYYNGRRFSAVPHRSVWTSDFMIYKTGDPNVTPGLYSTNRLKVSVGSSPRSGGAVTTSWWDDVYLKEEGDWLADDRGDTGAILTVAKQVRSLGEAMRESEGTYVAVSGVSVTAGLESFSSRAYVEQKDRSAGMLILVAGGTVPRVGYEVAVVGRVGRLDGEPALLDARVDVIATAQPLRPIALPGRAFLPWSLPLQCLIVTTWGSVVYVAPDNSFFTLDDGTGLTDGGGHRGLKVVLSGTAQPILPPAPGVFAVVTGIAGCEWDGEVPVLRPRFQGDIR